MKAGTPMGTGANLGQVVTGVATCCPPIVLDRVERLCILRRRRDVPWGKLAQEIRYSGSAVSEAVSIRWRNARLKEATREKILTALESVLEEER